MHERLRGVRRMFAGCAVLASIGCGPGADPAGTATRSDAVASTQDALKRSGPTVTPQTSGTTSGLIAISALNARVAWAVGRAGTYTITTDGGKSWRPGVVPGAEALQFRDVEAVSEKVAYLLSLPTDTVAPRIYQTVDGGKTWKIQFEAPDVSYFYDCFAFWDPWSGLTMADSLNGEFPVVRTFDGGRSWRDIGGRVPAPLPGEAGFASSGTCAATQGHRRAWLTTGGTGVTRVFYSTDRGQTWGATTAPITAGVDQAGGGFSIAFRDARHGILGGGDLAASGVVANIARSSDGGKTWVAGTSAPIPGAIYGLAYAGNGRGESWGSWGRDDDEGEDDGHGGGRPIRVVATAPTGTAWSPDEGRSWKSLAGLAGLWAVDFGSDRTGWLVGTNGQIVRIDF